jgi:hypothetical protein
VSGTVEKGKGNVQVIPPGDGCRCDLGMSVLPPDEAVHMEEQITQILEKHWDQPR